MFLTKLKIAMSLFVVTDILAASVGGFTHPVMADKPVRSAPGDEVAGGEAAGGAEKPQAVEKWQDQATLKEPKIILLGVTFSPDGKMVAAVAWAETVVIWNLPSNEVRTRLKTGHRGHIAVAFSPDSKTIASTGADGVVRLWDVATGKERSAWKLLQKKDDEIVLKSAIDGGLDQLAFSPDGKSLAAAGETLVKIWDVSTGVEQASFEGHSDTIHSLAYALGGKALITGSVDRLVKVWDLETAKVRIALEGPADGHIAVSPDGKTLAMRNDQEDTVTLWDVETGTEKATWKDLRAHRLAFARDGKALAIGADRHVKLWDVDTGKELATLKRDETSTRLQSLAFSPNGKMLAATGNDVELPSETVTGVLNLWELRAVE